MDFGRPPLFFGVRFRFVPWDPSEDEDNGSEELVPEAGEVAGGTENALAEEGDEPFKPAKDFVTVRFEPYSQDRSQIWIEVASTARLKHFVV